ncbi:sigma factor-like helix-turn-helix DNA-binding protein [Desulfosporosinus hippei]|uniref:RNA polymerase nonessential primary-like sigma factor n=1 Tax=Desulfosporosinus hippei DSM 8344 TaxID=1121419 RepID=A0A1G8CEB9_9FIRM|nr:sigma factor-like helix-turn-helix DNA-binding protein [Desulfosporosinus hippei]SDH43795.1 RNA polymerase nonessential primary-like sigma factor [Desulfosporosinus hippei DSM 8344]
MYTRKQIMNAIENCLDESESKIIKTRFGIEDGLTVRLNEIEIKLGVKKEQVREIEKKVLKYLKKHC